MDLMHAVPFARNTRIWAGTVADCAGAAITVIAAGASQKPGESRLDLLRKNAAIFREIVPAVAAANPDGIILVATNPVDVLAYLTFRISGLPAARVIGSGTILDTARFRALLADYYGVDPRSVHAYIAGEHGDTEVPVWSLPAIAGMSLADFATANGMEHDPARLREIFEATRDAAYRIIDLKGATYFAVAAGILRIVEAILRDQSTVLSVSSLICDYYGIDDVYLSVPTVVGRAGVEGRCPAGCASRGGARGLVARRSRRCWYRHGSLQARRRAAGRLRTSRSRSRAAARAAATRRGAVPPTTSQPARAPSSARRRAARPGTPGSAASAAIESSAPASAAAIVASSRASSPTPLRSASATSAPTTWWAARNATPRRTRASATAVAVV